MTTLLKKEKYAPLVIYMRSLGKLGCPVFFPHQFYPTARIIAQFASFIIWCEANDRISFRGEQRAAAAMFVYLHCTDKLMCLSAKSIGPALLLLMNLKERKYKNRSSVRCTVEQ